MAYNLKSHNIYFNSLPSLTKKTNKLYFLKRPKEN